MTLQDKKNKLEELKEKLNIARNAVDRAVLSDKISLLEKEIDQEPVSAPVVEKVVEEKPVENTVKEVVEDNKDSIKNDIDKQQRKDLSRGEVMESSNNFQNHNNKNKK